MKLVGVVINNMLYICSECLPWKAEELTDTNRFRYMECPTHGKVLHRLAPDITKAELDNLAKARNNT